MDDIRVPHLLSSTTVSLTLGTNFIGNIQASLTYMVEQMTADERAALQQRVESRQALEGRDLVVFTLSALSMNILQEATRTEQVEYRSVQSTLGL